MSESGFVCNLSCQRARAVPWLTLTPPIQSVLALWLLLLLWSFLSLVSVTVRAGLHPISAGRLDGIGGSLPPQARLASPEEKREKLSISIRQTRDKTALDFCPFFLFLPRQNNTNHEQTRASGTARDLLWRR